MENMTNSINDILKTSININDLPDGIICKHCRICQLPEEIDDIGLCQHCNKVYYNIIPQKYLDKGFDNFEVNDNNRRVFNMMREFVKSYNNKGIFLTGTVGSGKTHLAIATLKELFMLSKSISIISMNELLLEIRSGYKYKENEEDVLQKYDTEYLLIDDVGIESPSEFCVSTFYMLIDRRYRSDKNKIIITSNLSLHQISEIYDDRIASRISEMLIISNLKDKDFRLETKQTSF